MFSLWGLTLAALAFLVLLFALAFWADRYHPTNRQRPIIYSLALGVHCTSWAFYGTTAQSAQYGWAFTPTYMGSIALFLFGYPILRKIIQLCQQHHISSVADFISQLYGKSHFLGALLTVICFIGVLPYIALQLDGVTASVDMLTVHDNQWPGGVSLYVAILMAIFAILFGTRSLSLTEKHPGLMLAIAFESIIKLLAFITIGLFVCYGLFDGVMDLLGKAQLHPEAKSVFTAHNGTQIYICHMLLGFASMLCLPRQFHINYVENNGEQELRTARWLFPVYLLAINLFVLPVALGGKILLNDASPDHYVIALPLLANNSWVAMAAFIGGLAASSSMVIVSTLAIGIMIANNLFTPLWLKLRFRADQQHALHSQNLLLIRRMTVLLVVGMAYGYYQYLSRTTPLVNSGIISMALFAQLLPSMLLGLLWPRRHPMAATVAIIAGCISWFVTMLWPSITSTYYFNDVPNDITLSHGVFISMGINLGCFLLLSLVPGKSQHMPLRDGQSDTSPISHAIRINALLAMTQRVFSASQQQQLTDSFRQLDSDGYASGALLSKIEAQLAAHVGSASARILLSAIAERQQVPLEQLVDLVEEATQNYQFSHELLQSSVEHIEQGISVVDRHLKLLAWNQRYLTLFNYPPDLVQAGIPIQTLLRFNAERGLFGQGKNVEQEIAKRVAFLQQGSRYKYVRTQPDGRTIELQGNPMPGGGFVTTYSDITEHMHTQQQLRDAKTSLEQRVTERTEQLQQANQALQTAKHQAEQANDSKTRFLAAAGHDLMQPFNAATLFGSMIEQQSDNPRIQDMASSLLQSLNNAEELLSMLLDMTKLESGVLTSHIDAFPLTDILQPLVGEFELQARQKGLQLRYVATDIIVQSDKKLLRRVLQNLLSNAIRYTEQGKILVGVRRHTDGVRILVCDTGMGIAKHQQREIFNEFHQLDQNNRQGLGLGLTIVERICHLLQHPVNIHSELSRGTCFSVTLPRMAASQYSVSSPTTVTPDKSLLLKGHRVLIIDNEPQILNAMSQLFSQWGAQVTAATGFEQAKNAMAAPPALMLVDYHLNHHEIGLDTALALHKIWHKKVPTIINSADYSEDIREHILDAGLTFLPKPLKTGALKKLIRKLLA